MVTWNSKNAEKYVISRWRIRENFDYAESFTLWNGPRNCFCTTSGGRPRLLPTPCCLYTHNNRYLSLSRGVLSKFCNRLQCAGETAACRRDGLASVVVQMPRWRWQRCRFSSSCWIINRWPWLGVSSSATASTQSRAAKWPHARRITCRVTPTWRICRWHYARTRGGGGIVPQTRTS